MKYFKKVTNPEAAGNTGAQDPEAAGKSGARDSRLKLGEVLTCKSRLCPKGFQDLDRPEEQRIDAPTASRTTLLVFLNVTIMMMSVRRDPGAR